MQKNKRDSHFDRSFSHPPEKKCLANTSPLFFELLNATHDGIIAFDEISNLIYINQSAQQTLGIKADDVLGKPAVSFIDDDNLLNSITHSSLDSMQSFIWRKHSLIVTVSRLNEDNRQKGCLLLLKETTSIKNSDDIDRIKEEFASLLESSYDGIILADRESILQVNASFGRITGVAPGQLIGKKFNELNNKKHVCLAAVQEVIRLTSYHKKTLTLQRHLTSGNEIFVTGNPLFDRHGQVIRVLLNVRDVTDLKSLEDQIKNVTNICKETKAMSDVNPHFFQGIVAESPSMRRLIELVLRVSRVDSTVMLVGESGVGKDVLARLLYRLSDRCQEPFISVNCGAIPDNLLESEFFGYMKGAFTGASTQGKAGLFEQADGGILFLDEVGELPLHLQVKLLKAIQDRCCRRLGDTKNINFDVRIIAATNRDLHQMVANGLFRADLFYRLYVVPINIPALKDRREDILPLSLMFLMQNNQKYKVNCTFGHELMSILETYEWPGNVRELQNVVERMVVTADADVLTPRHLPRSVQNTDGIGLPYSDLPDTMNLKIAREALECKLIERAIAKTGNTRGTGKLLGIDHSTVIRKAQRYGIDIRAVVSRARQKAAVMLSR
ncbi:MAG: sigma 54-interacting transcriptional regulator [Deltaproteobacteria bacterium]|uniref:sigma 54-interacting transcriptional regulator n=1 Tax=Desulfobacula sp. TaxID=2593537 RepID=UPI001999F3C3|nr:sigma 54-interacting transcriptional regulator [Candidatus Desulfobacula maris]MBL6992985.1 sigma 54-interacting transcriptional regulator [Desulfobacula sp.]